MDVTDNSRISNWVSDQLLKVMRTDITTQIVRNGWPILGLSAYTEDIERAVIAKANEQLHNYGVAITRMGNFDVNLSPEDSTSLKRLARDTSYSRLAGSFNQYAAGEMQIGAGEGMAQGGGAVSGAFLGAGLGIGGGGGAQYPPTPPPAAGFAGGGPTAYQGPPAGGGQPEREPQQALPSGPDDAGQDQPQAAACPSCQAANSPGAKFCQNCGQPMAPPKVHCTNCGQELSPGAKFCPECGTPAGGAKAGGTSSS